MAEYIEREAVIDEIEDTTWYHISCQKNLVEGAACEADALYKATDIYNVIKSVPTADVVEVVRCGQCKHAYINSFSAKEGIALCRFLTNHAIDGTSFVRKQDDYCSYGERWGGDTE